MKMSYQLFAAALLAGSLCNVSLAERSGDHEIVFVNRSAETITITTRDAHHVRLGTPLIVLGPHSGREVKFLITDVPGPLGPNASCPTELGRAMFQANNINIFHWTRNCRESVRNNITRNYTRAWNHKIVMQHQPITIDGASISVRCSGSCNPSGAGGRTTITFR